MSDTIGSTIDKLITVDTKLWNLQSKLYIIRKMSFEQFLEAFETQEQMRVLFDTLASATDLNVQRSALVNEIDSLLIKLLEASRDGSELDNGKNLQKAHKQY